jgi:hypothetical protein
MWIATLRRMLLLEIAKDSTFNSLRIASRGSSMPTGKVFELGKSAIAC